MCLGLTSSSPRPAAWPERERLEVKVFISYRRKDSHYIADRIYDWIEREFGADNIFKDVDSIPLGRDFRRILHDAVARCDALLVVIGPRWLNETDAEGRRRVDDPGDYVRIEIETALTRDVPVIPLLVDGAPFPRREDLPPSLQDLVYRHGTLVRPDPDFRHDMGRLIKALREIVPVVSGTAPTEAVQGPGPDSVKVVEAPTEAMYEPPPDSVKVVEAPTEVVHEPGPDSVKVVEAPTEAVDEPGPDSVKVVDAPTKAVQESGPSAVEIADDSPSRPLAVRSGDMGSVTPTPEGLRRVEDDRDVLRHPRAERGALPDKKTPPPRRITVSRRQAVRLGVVGLSVAASGGVYWSALGRRQTGIGVGTLVQSVPIPPEGSTPPSGAGDEAVRLRRVSDRSLLRTLERHMGWVTSVAFTPDGSTLASGSDDTTIRLWRVSDGSPLRTLVGHLAAVSSPETSVMRGYLGPHSWI